MLVIFDAESCFRLLMPMLLLLLSSLCVTGNTTKHDTTVIYFISLFLCTPFCKGYMHLAALVCNTLQETLGSIGNIDYLILFQNISTFVPIAIIYHYYIILVSINSKGITVPAHRSLLSISVQTGKTRRVSSMLSQRLQSLLASLIRFESKLQVVAATTSYKSPSQSKLSMHPTQMCHVCVCVCVEEI